MKWKAFKNNNNTYVRAARKNSIYNEPDELLHVLSHTVHRMLHNLNCKLTVCK